LHSIHHLASSLSMEEIFLLRINCISSRCNFCLTEQRVNEGSQCLLTKRFILGGKTLWSLTEHSCSFLHHQQRVEREWIEVCMKNAHLCPSAPTPSK
jgi:hypothetical protein